MRVDWKLGDYGFIVRKFISFDLEKGKIANIEGILVDAPGPINPKLKSITLKGDRLVVETSIKTVVLEIPPKARFFMKRWFNIISQCIGVAAQVLNGVGDIVPVKYQVLAAGIIGTAQGIIAVIAHNFNPDGTSATSAYRPQDNLPLMK